MEMAKAVKHGFQVVSKIGSSLGTSPKTTCITVQDGDKIKIDLDKLRKVLIRPEIGDSPIAIISIAGPMRTGKSFMMNYFAKRLNDMQDKNWMSDDTNAEWLGKVFSWKAGTQRETTGINIGNDIYQMTGKNGEKVVVLLLDTQGLFDNHTPENVNKTLLTLSTLMSSVQIFNIKEHVDAQNLSYLKTCVDFAMATAQAKAPSFKLQDLMFLVRDSVEEDDESQNETFGFNPGNRYIRKIIESKSGGPEQIEIRKRIDSSFNTVRCFMMPHPGMAATKKKFSGKTCETDKEFQEMVKKFVENVADPKNLAPKGKEEENGKHMTARELLNLIGAFDRIFTTKLFAVKDMMEASIKSYYVSKSEEALLQYDDRTRDVFVSNGIKTDDELTKRHKESKALALYRFDSIESMGNGDEKKFYRNHLEKKCNEHYESAIERWKAKQNEIRIKRNLETAEVFAKYESEMHEQRLKETSLEDSEWEDLHKSYLCKMIQQSEGKIDVKELTWKAENHLKMLLDTNRERRNFEKKLVDEKRQVQLYALSQKLQDKSLKLWSERFEKGTKPFTDDEMRTQEQEVTKILHAEYYKEALLPDELEHLQKLDNKMNEEYQQAVAACRSKSSYRDCTPPFEVKNEKEKLSSVVDKLVASYAKNLKQDLALKFNETSMLSQKPSRQDDKRQAFYDACSEHIRKYYGDLCCALKKNAKEAKKKK